MEKQCPCGEKLPNQTDRKKYCSKICFYKYRVRPKGLKYVLVKENPTSFKKGLVPWNKGIEGDYLRQWKGDDAEVNTIHKWITKKLGRPQKCEMCGSTKKQIYHWSNKEHTYKRILEDWQRLCMKCHWAYDKQYNNR